MLSLQFDIPGKPVGKGRPRFGKGRTWTPKATVNFETLVRLEFHCQCPGHEPVTTPVQVSVFAFFAVPKSRSKTFRRSCAGGTVPCTTRPDSDNILKIICDALNGIAYVDDRQVCWAQVRKLYTTGSPRTVVLLKWDEEDSQ